MAPLVIITASAKPDDELEAMASGATAYLAKPFRPEDLRKIVHELLAPRIPDTTT
jgi:CheY-like chemotaxis protein